MLIIDLAAYAATQLNSKINDVQKQIGAKKKVSGPCTLSLPKSQHHD